MTSFYLLWTKDQRSLCQHVSDYSRGSTHGSRWEWGIGKGRFAWAARKFRDESSLEGRIRRIWFLIGSYYSWDLKGTSEDARAVYEFRP